MSKQIAQTVGDKRIAWLLAIIAAFAVLATVATAWRESSAAEMPQDAFQVDVANAAISSTGDSKPTDNEIVVNVTDPIGMITAGQYEGVTASTAQLAGDSRFVQSGSTDGITNAAVSTTADSGKLPGNPWNARHAAGKSIPLSAFPVNLFIDHWSTVTRLDADDANNVKSKTITANVSNVASYDSAVLVSLTMGGRTVDGYVRLVEQNHGQTAEYVDIAGLVNGDSGTLMSALLLSRERTGSGEVIASGALAPGDDISSGIVPSSNLDGTGPSDTYPVASSQEGLKASGGGATAWWLYIALGLSALAFLVGGRAVARRSR